MDDEDEELKLVVISEDAELEVVVEIEVVLAEEEVVDGQ